MPTNALPEKNLLGQAWRLAFGLQSDGWILRSDIIWHKRSPMPESVTDRPTRSHEYIFLLAKQGRYFYDAEAVREPLQTLGDNSGTRVRGDWRAIQNGGKMDGLTDSRRIPPNRPSNYIGPANGHNCRSVWSFSSEPMGVMKYWTEDGWKTIAHYAAFPTALPERCIKAGTSEKGCCAKCGAGWRRLMERTDNLDISARGSRFDKGKTVSRDNGRSTQAGERFLNRQLGWQPGCNCNAETAPCRVIDPFSGTGSTGIAANALGRDYVGIELNPDYAAASLHRAKNPEAFDSPTTNAPADDLFDLAPVGPKTNGEAVGST